MANERYEEEGQEEGEYHFSDDQANYDMDVGAVKGSTATAAFTTRESIAGKLKQHRRIVIGILVFIVLLGIVYKLVAPSSTPVTDFQPNAPVVKTSAKKMTPPPHATTQPQVVQQQTVTTTSTTQPAVQTQPVVTQPTVSVSRTDSVTTDNKNVIERITAIEQQNAATMNLMQTQYAQKIADNEAENQQLRNQVQELNARISNMEVAFRQLTKILRGSNASSSGAASPRAAVPQTQAAQVSQPHSLYTVQAIIPGRAWLKSDAGDTVTVAEGDVLKDFGRITKIDPYDGIVDIDTGSKIISLSYGASGD